ncbi:MAG: hypothetical protein V7459_01390 [Oceanicoccus sp.]
MLRGNASISSLAQSAATINQYSQETIEFNDVVCFQMTMEMRNQAREAVLPPALHPTIPASLSLQVWEVGSSIWGQFTMAVCRIACRSGVRARGFTSRVYVSSESVAEKLATTFGFPASVAELSFRHSYDGADIHVIRDGEKILSVASLNPEPMGLNDVQYTGTLSLAHTPNGLRLVQLEAQHSCSRVERLSSRLVTFVPEAWGNALFDPYTVVSSSIANQSVSFPPVRFVCKPDELAFTGTEAVKIDQ